MMRIAGAGSPTVGVSGAMTVEGNTYISGNVGINDTNIGSYALKMTQVADSQGIYITGYDDQTANLRMQIAANGLSELKGSTNISLMSTAGYTKIDSSQHIYYDVGSTSYDHIWRQGSTEIGIFTGDGKLGIGTSSPGAYLQVAASDLSAVFGSDEGTNGTLTNATQKTARIGIPHYDNSEPYMALVVGLSNSYANILQYGGGSSSFNAATEHRFYTGGDHTTTNGTQKMIIKSDGKVGIGTSIAPDATLQVAGDVKFADTLNNVHLTIQETGTNSALISGANSAGLYFATQSGTRLELTGNHIIKTGQTIDNMLPYNTAAVHTATTATQTYQIEAMADPSQAGATHTTELTLPDGNVGGERFTVTCMAIGNFKPGGGGTILTGTVKINGTFIDGTNFTSPTVSTFTGATAANTGVMQVKTYEFTWVQASFNPSGLGGWVYTVNTM
jgi:hypothetical protein